MAASTTKLKNMKAQNICSLCSDGRNDEKYWILLLSAVVFHIKNVKFYLRRIANIACCNKGHVYGNRKILHEMNVKRPLTDIQMWTHIFFIFPIALAPLLGFIDIFVLLSVSSTLSILYHYDYEKPGLIATAEGFVAKFVFAYAVFHLLYTPSREVFFLEFTSFVLTVVVFLGTNLIMDSYESWHYFMHIIPSFWATIIVLYHKPNMLH